MILHDGPGEAGECIPARVERGAGLTESQVMEFLASRRPTVPRSATDAFDKRTELV
ncbi:hypothetical protein ACFXPV_29090 [Streptomyces sp. NPDC059118]|uniref:hypothetical protein n=1 Tax=unclassified Streptomyces TaxID=2593676 RepID=UPI0036C4B8AB